MIQGLWKSCILEEANSGKNTILILHFEFFFSCTKVCTSILHIRVGLSATAIYLQCNICLAYCSIGSQRYNQCDLEMRWRRDGYGGIRVHPATKIPFMYSQKRIARSQYQFPRSCVCELFIYSYYRSIYFLQKNRQTDHENI